VIYISKNHSTAAEHIQNSAPFSFIRSLFDAGYTRVVMLIAYMIVLWQFPSKEEEQHMFRTTPREHWWI